MNVKEFVNNLKLNVNGPAYRGAELPKKALTSINESNFHDDLRFKEYDIEKNNNELTVKWMSQAWPNNDYEECIKFCNEVGRAVIAAADACELEDELVINIMLYSRDHDDDDDEIFTSIIHIIPEAIDKHTLYIKPY